jgi:hypothetical protein
MLINVVNKKNHKITPIDFYIARPSPLGNPYSHKKSKFNCIIVDNRQKAIDNYEEWLKFKIKDNDPIIINELKKLTDFYIKNNFNINLVCWCKPKPCHGDILKKFLEKKLFK